MIVLCAVRAQWAVAQRGTGRQAQLTGSASDWATAVPTGPTDNRLRTGRMMLQELIDVGATLRADGCADATRTNAHPTG